MNYQGQGKLIGYHTYKKDNVDKHIYDVLNGTIDPKTGLYDKLEYIQVFSEEQTLKDLKPQEVAFEIELRQFGGKTMPRYSNIQSVGGKK